MISVKFEDEKENIQKEIEKKISTGVIKDPGGFILIEGFINMPTQNEVGGAFVIGGPTIPTVAVVGKTTGLVYTFALKILLPNIKL
jgi:hypothetical protein